MESQSPWTLLVVDDEPSHLKILAKILRKEGYEVFTASHGREALDLLHKQGVRIDVVMTDWIMPEIDGLDLLKHIQLLYPNIEVIVMTAFGTIERALKAIREGAYDFIEKPIKRALLLKTVRQALERKALRVENLSLKQALKDLQNQEILIGRSPAMESLIEMIHQVAPTTATVLIQGASGTGKEWVARALHRLSPRRHKAFVTINCAAIPEHLLESELFGHEKGAFTGAHQRRIGRFEAAHGGSLFLDEVAELQPELQAKLLRVLQEREIERLGSSESIPIDVRIIAATNKSLIQEVKAGRFRQDLFYRLDVIPLHLPLLKDRREDIPLLAQHFLQTFAQKYHRKVIRLTDRAIKALEAYDWPGNVRELRNAIERAVVLTRDEAIDLRDLPLSCRLPGIEDERGRICFSIGTPLEEIKRQVIVKTLEVVGQDKKQAAQLLGIATRTIYRILDQIHERDQRGSSNDDEGH